MAKEPRNTNKEQLKLINKYKIQTRIHDIKLRLWQTTLALLPIKIKILLK